MSTEVTVFAEPVQYDVETRIADIKAEAANVPAKIESKADRKLVGSFLRAVAGDRTKVDKARKEANVNAREFIKANDSAAKQLISQIEEIEDPFKVERDAWDNKIKEEEAQAQREAEEAEQARKDVLLNIQAYRLEAGKCHTSTEVKAVLDIAEAYVPEVELGDLEETFCNIRDNVLFQIKSQYNSAVQREDQQAQMAKQKAEQDAKEAEFAKEREALEKEKREMQEVQDKLLKAEQERVHAEQQKLRVEADAKAREAQAQAKAEADKLAEEQARAKSERDQAIQREMDARKRDAEAKDALEKAQKAQEAAERPLGVAMDALLKVTEAGSFEEASKIASEAYQTILNVQRGVRPPMPVSPQAQPNFASPKAPVVSSDSIF